MILLQSPQRLRCDPPTGARHRPFYTESFLTADISSITDRVSPVAGGLHHSLALHQGLFTAPAPLRDHSFSCHPVYELEQ